MATPLISVVIASYNHAPYVGAALDSVGIQGIADLEILVTDDASTDHTAQVVAQHPDPRIRLHVHPHNRGACAAMNQAIQRARGQYIAVLNSDDLFLPGKLQAQLEAFDRQPQLGAVFGLPVFINEHGQPLDDPAHKDHAVFHQPNRSRHAWLAHFFDQCNALCHPTALIRRSVYQAVGLYDERLAQVPDLDLWVRLARHHEIQVLQQPLTGFRILPGQINASGARPEVIIRDCWERAQVMRRYLALTPDELALVFPDFPTSGHSPAAYLAHRALSHPTGYPFYQRFGLDTLFESLPAQADTTGTATAIRAFIQRTGQTDLHRLYPPSP